MIVLLGLELVTGNFALVPLGVREGKTSLAALASNWGWVFLGNLLGSIFYALLFTSDQRAKTLTVAIADLAGGRVSDYGLIATAGVLAALPPVVIGLVMQRALISGLTSGGVKG